MRPLIKGFDAFGEWVGEVYDSILYSSSYRSRALIDAGIDPNSEYAKRFDVHHVVQRGHNGAAPARANLAAVGIDVDDLENLLVMDKANHRSIHTNVYRNSVNTATAAALGGGYNGIVSALDGIKTRLITTGKYP